MDSMECHYVVIGEGLVWAKLDARCAIASFICVCLQSVYSASVLWGTIESGTDTKESPPWKKFSYSAKMARVSNMLSPQPPPLLVFFVIKSLNKNDWKLKLHFY